MTIALYSFDRFNRNGIYSAAPGTAVVPHWLLILAGKHMTKCASQLFTPKRVLSAYFSSYWVQKSGYCDGDLVQVSALY